VQRLAQAFRTWLPLAVAVVALAGLVYLAVQQSYRMGLNDPQIQLAQDGAVAMARGALPAAAASGSVDVAASLAPWCAVYDDAGSPVASGARLDGAPPRPPAGVFAFARAHGEDRVSWQPRPGVRVALVVERWSGGFVASGRNMREVEKRVDDLGKITGLVVLVTLGATFAAAFVVARP
jgi:hypothetical protein